MKRLNNSLWILLLFTVITFGCSNEKSKEEMLTKSWNVTELDLSGTRLSGDQVNMNYQFNKDGTFSRTEDGKTEDGTWQLSEDGKKLTLIFNDQDLEAEKTVEKLSEQQLVISGEEFSMQRTVTMEPAK